MITFKKYLKQYLEDDSPKGDFARDVYNDSFFSEDINTPEELLAYLCGRRANEKVMSIAGEIMNHYQILKTT